MSLKKIISVTAQSGLHSPDFSDKLMPNSQDYLGKIIGCLDEFKPGLFQKLQQLVATKISPIWLLEGQNGFKLHFNCKNNGTNSASLPGNACPHWVPIYYQDIFNRQTQYALTLLMAGYCEDVSQKEQENWLSLLRDALNETSFRTSVITDLAKRNKLTLYHMASFYSRVHTTDSDEYKKSQKFFHTVVAMFRSIGIEESKDVLGNTGVQIYHLLHGAFSWMGALPTYYDGTRLRSYSDQSDLEAELSKNTGKSVSLVGHSTFETFVGLQEAYLDNTSFTEFISDKEGNNGYAAQPIKDPRCESGLCQITIANHPTLSDQFGVFSGKRIKKSTIVGAYGGPYTARVFGSHYGLQGFGDYGTYPDKTSGQLEGSPMMFVNFGRSVEDDWMVGFPNLFRSDHPSLPSDFKPKPVPQNARENVRVRFRLVNLHGDPRYVQTRQLRCVFPVALLCSNRDIMEGEELLWGYGLDPYQLFHSIPEDAPPLNCRVLVERLTEAREEQEKQATVEKAHREAEARALRQAVEKAASERYLLGLHIIRNHRDYTSTRFGAFAALLVAEGQTPGPWHVVADVAVQMVSRMDGFLHRSGLSSLVRGITGLSFY